MGAEEHDIVARVSHSAGTSSTGALAAHLGQACGHVLLDARVVQQGYRFYPELGDEIPAFFNRRISTGSGTVAITLQGGMEPNSDGSGPFTGAHETWHEDLFAGCRSTADARAIFEAEDYHASLWLARVTVGVQLMDIEAVAAPLFIAKHPNEFRVIAEELVSLGVVQGHACPMCSED